MKKTLTFTALILASLTMTNPVFSSSISEQIQHQEAFELNTWSRIFREQFSHPNDPGTDDEEFYKVFPELDTIAQILIGEGAKSQEEMDVALNSIFTFNPLTPKNPNYLSIDQDLRKSIDAVYVKRINPIEGESFLSYKDIIKNILGNNFPVAVPTYGTSHAHGITISSRAFMLHDLIHAFIDPKKDLIYRNAQRFLNHLTSQGFDKSSAISLVTNYLVEVNNLFTRALSEILTQIETLDQKSPEYRKNIIGFFMLIHEIPFTMGSTLEKMITGEVPTVASMFDHMRQKSREGMKAFSPIDPLPDFLREDLSSLGEETLKQKIIDYEKSKNDEFDPSKITDFKIIHNGKFSIHVERKMDLEGNLFNRFSDQYLTLLWLYESAQHNNKYMLGYTKEKINPEETRDSHSSIRYINDVNGKLQEYIDFFLNYAQGFLGTEQGALFERQYLDIQTPEIKSLLESLTSTFSVRVTKEFNIEDFPSPVDETSQKELVSLLKSHGFEFDSLKESFFLRSIEKRSYVSVAWMLNQDPTLIEKISVYNFPLPVDEETQQFILMLKDKLGLGDLMDRAIFEKSYAAVAWMLNQDSSLIGKINTWSLPLAVDNETRQYILMLKDKLGLGDLMSRAISEKSYDSVEWLLDQDSSLIGQINTWSLPLPVDNETQQYILMLKDKLNLGDLMSRAIFEKSYAAVAWMLDQDSSLIRQINTWSLPLPVDNETRQFLLGLKTKGMELGDLIYTAFRESSYDSVAWLLHQDPSLIEKINTWGLPLPADEKTQQFLLDLKNVGWDLDEHKNDMLSRAMMETNEIAISWLLTKGAVETNN